MEAPPPTALLLSQAAAAMVRMAMMEAATVTMALHPVMIRSGCRTKALPIFVKVYGS